MSEKILIASDSTTDLPPELVERYHIKIIPLGVTLGEKTYTDGVDIDPDGIYRHYAQTGELPKTSAVNIAEFLSFFRQIKRCLNACLGHQKCSRILRTNVIL